MTKDGKMYICDRCGKEQFEARDGFIDKSPKGWIYTYQKEFNLLCDKCYAEFVQLKKDFLSNALKPSRRLGYDELTDSEKGFARETYIGIRAFEEGCSESDVNPDGVKFCQFERDEDGVITVLI